MSWVRHIVVMCSGLLAVVPAVVAQSLAPAVPEGPVLERALQQADGPRRRILEAARAKPAAARPREAAVPPAPLVALVLADALPPLEVAVTEPLRGIAALPPIATPAPAALPGELPPAPELLPLKLLTLVEPSLPERLRRRVTGKPEFVVDLTVGEDGRVLQAVVRPPVLPEVASRIEEAVRQWRYAPQPMPRTHQVTLVLNPG